MRVSAWEALCAGDPRSVARTKKAYYGFSRDIPPTLLSHTGLKRLCNLCTRSEWSRQGVSRSRGVSPR